MIYSVFNAAVLLAVAGYMGELIGAYQRHMLIRKALYASTMLFITAGSVLLLLARPELGTILVVFINLFRLLNCMRVLKGRMKLEHGYGVTRRTSLSLLLVQAVLVSSLILVSIISPDLKVLLGLYGVLMAFSAVVLCRSTFQTLRHSRLRLGEKTLSLRDCPTVSVCIPARNETEELAACLKSVLACTYPKLEILVLDDCSQDKTSEIIKKFAHEGARFIKGGLTREGWLAKNQAYETLASAANGELLLFCGVDVRFDPESIGHLVRLKLARNKTMLSVMPQRADTAISSGIIQPARYWWEIALPRRIFNRPPVLSTLWLIEANALQKLGGFKAVGNSIVPEAHFARELVGIDGYSFVTTTPDLQVFSVKNAAEQKATAIRVRYPQLRRRPEVVLLVFLAETSLLLAPFIFAAIGFFTGIGPLWPLSLLAAVLLTVTHNLIMRAWDPRNWRLTGLVDVILADLCLLIISMWQYEFATVTWKDRNICIPVMQIIPHLPEIKD